MSRAFYRMCSIRILLTVLALISILTYTGCSKQDSGKGLKLYVGIPPQVYFVERIVGQTENIDIKVLLLPGNSPATYEPSPKEMAEFSKADAYFLMGLPFELKLMEKSSEIIGEPNVIDTRKGINLRTIEDHSHHGHGDDSHGHADEIIFDPHIWLDPQLAVILCRNICDGLKQIDSVNAETYENNLQILITDLYRSDSVIAESLDPLKGRSFYTFHPTFGYFANRYGLHQVAIETAGKEPGAKQLAEIVTQAKNDKIKAILVQREFSYKTAEAIAEEIGGEIIIVDPLSKDYLNNLIDITSKIVGAL